MRLALPALGAVLALGALAGCERPASTSSTTIVKEPVVQKETKETIVQNQTPPSPSTTIVQPAPNVTIETEKKPETTETSRSTTTSRVDTPYGSATRTDTETTKTTQ